MIPNNFYSLINTNEISGFNHYIFTVVINCEHQIFEGHFPKNPVVPGVLMLAMVKDVLENQLNKTMQLVNSKNIKYMNILIPILNQQIEIDIQLEFSTTNNILVNGTIKHAETVFCKYKLEFIETPTTA